MTIARPRHVAALTRLLVNNPVVALLGARQTGKSTLARALARGRQATYFDLEDPETIAHLTEPMLALKPLRGLVVLDEIQRRPELFPVLRVLADRPSTPARFLVLGSASPALLRQSSETLAGRVAFYELPGLSLGEVGAERFDRLWFRGGFPRALLASSHAASVQWRKDFVRTFLEREVLPLGVGLPAAAMERFWAMLAHYHAQVWNASELARSFGVSHTVVARYLDLLTGTFVVDQLRPWHENAGKRVVKSPKVYVVDSGLFHSLMGIASPAALARHPKVGASWEGFMIMELRRHLGIDRGEAFFWATHGGAELDLLVVRGDRRLGFEVKRTSSPKLTPSMRHALVDLRLESIDVLHAGERTFMLAPQVRAVAARRLLEDVAPLAKA